MIKAFKCLFFSAVLRVCELQENGKKSDFCKMQKIKRCINYWSQNYKKINKLNAICCMLVAVSGKM